MNPLPQSPDDMPPLFHNNAESIRNMLVTLDDFCSVHISWELDSYSDDSEDAHGTWIVEIGTNKRLVFGKHRYITNAIWYAYTIALAADNDEYEQRESARKAALAKLTPDERKLLRLE